MCYSLTIDYTGGGTLSLLHTDMDSADVAAAINEANYNFTVIPGLVTPLLAVAVGVLMILSTTANTIIIIHALIKASNLKQSSVILLFNLALANLLMSVLFMPTLFITLVAERWVFGATAQQKNGTCMFIGFVFAYSTSVSVHTLAAISFDRFLFIVKPLVHKKVMKFWVIWLLVALIWFVGLVTSITPFVGLGRYAFSSTASACLPLWSTRFVIFLLVESTLPFGIITVTTVWTFIFTRSFIRTHYRVSRASTINENESGGHTDNSVYNMKLKKVFGIFGSLLVVNMVCFVPFIVTGIAGFIVGFDNFPTGVYATVLFLYLLNNVGNPLVQSLFRPDMKMLFLKLKRKIKRSSNSHLDTSHHQPHSDTHASRLCTNTTQHSPPDSQQTPSPLPLQESVPEAPSLCTPSPSTPTSPSPSQPEEANVESNNIE